MATNCKKCNQEYHGLYKMVMLKDEIWEKVSDGDLEACICSDCLEEIMEVDIIPVEAFKPSIYGPVETHIPCNQAYLYMKDMGEELYSKIYK